MIVHDQYSAVLSVIRLIYGRAVSKIIMNRITATADPYPALKNGKACRYMKRAITSVE